MYGKSGEGGSVTSNLTTERWACTLPEPTAKTDKLHSYFKDISAAETRKAIPFQLYKEEIRQPASLAWPFVIFYPLITALVWPNSLAGTIIY